MDATTNVIVLELMEMEWQTHAKRNNKMKINMRRYINAAWRRAKLPFFFFVRKFVCPFLSIKPNKIVFDNFGGRGLGDSPMYIAMEIIRQRLDYDLVWLVKNMNEEMPCEIRKVKYNSIKSIIEIATSKIYVDNQILGMNEDKRDGQYYIQTWHGGGVLLKYVQRGATDAMSVSEIRRNKRNSKKIDLIISDNQLTTDDYKENFWIPDSCEILECGMPCKDGLYRTDEDVALIKKSIIGDKDVKIALYAPTFRDDYSVDGYKCDLEAVRRKLEERTSEKWVIIVRMHPNAIKFASLFSFNDNIINGSNASNPMDMAVVSDLLITDYSSMSSDFLYLDKPVFILALDLDHYINKCRKLHAYYYSLPYPFCKTNEELLKAIDDFNHNSYIQAVREYKTNILKPFGNGHASETVVERIKQVIGE